MKFSGSNKIETAIFISGNGSNLENLIKFSKSKKSPIKIEFVISNKKAKGLRYAKQEISVPKNLKKLKEFLKKKRN